MNKIIAQQHKASNKKSSVIQNSSKVARGALPVLLSVHIPERGLKEDRFFPPALFSLAPQIGNGYGSPLTTSISI